jgi:rSAM/selenodomain-associated transferase 2
LRISIIVPVLDEAPGIEAALGALRGLRGRGHEVIVVDGGSADATRRLAGPLADRVLAAPRGRAAQMNAGAQAAQGDALLFLHVDTRLPADADGLVAAALAHRTWGRFDVRIDSPHPALALVGSMMNLRSRLTGIATGDQAMFVRREAFDAAGGFPAIALMEDIGLCSALKQIAPCTCLKARVITSARRWKARGPMRTLLLMWWLRAAYFFGADPEHLAVRYGYRPRDP